MTIKVDGTNGILQSYDFQVPTTGFSYTFPTGIQTVILAPAATLASGTVTMPAVPTDGMVVTIESTQQITALTIAANSGQSIVAGAVTLRANQPLSYIFRSTNNTWYPFSGAANSDIISGTAVASTSGTAIDFTGIPSWAKRITVMFNGVSTNGTSVVLLQIGAGSVTTTGYLGSVAQSTGANSVSGANFSTGFRVDDIANATGARFGNAVLTLMGSNTWVFSSVMGRSDGTSSNTGGGAIALSGSLDRVRITTVNGTDTFDAGSINILYE